MTNIYLPCAINATYVPIKTFITQLFEGFLFEKNPCSCKECCFSFQEVPFFVLFRGSHLKEPIASCKGQWGNLEFRDWPQSNASLLFPMSTVLYQVWWKACYWQGGIKHESQRKLFIMGSHLKGPTSNRFIQCWPIRQLGIQRLTSVKSTKTSYKRMAETVEIDLRP